MSEQKEASKLRQIKPIKITDILPSSVIESDEKPTIEWIDPNTLYIEEKYQRNINERSVSLIRKIYKEFQWSRFKLPICSWGTDNKLFVIDGQHTAIAAASHPKIKKIPVMIVSANTMKERANAFMGHNRDRLAITSSQMYFSSVAAGDESALKAKKAMDATGVSVIRYNPPEYKIGQTLAAGTIMKMAARKDAEFLTRVLQILIDAKRAPVIALEINTVADLLVGKEWKGKFDDYDLSVVIKSKSAEQWRATAEAQVRKGQSMAMKRALAITWYRHVPKIKAADRIKIKTL